MNKKRNFIFTDRDLLILKALNNYRYLKTSQIKRLVFADNSTLQSTRRRLRFLENHRFISKVTPFFQLGKGKPELAYFLDKTGVDYLTELGLSSKFWRKAKDVKHIFLEHALDLSDFRINLELALEQKSQVFLDTFIADFEMRAQSDKSLGKNRYKLYSKVLHPINRESYVVYPDALIILSSGHHKQLYYLEIDRGTEGLKQIRDKLIGYNLFYKKELFKKYGDFHGFKVLIQTSSPKRALNIRNTLLEQGGESMVLVTSVEQVSQDSVLTGHIWIDDNNQKKSLLK